MSAQITPKLEPKHIDTLVALIECGPLDDGELPSKSARDDLITWGYAVKIVIEGEDGYQAATYAGRDLYCQHFGSNLLSEDSSNRSNKNVH